MLSGELGLEVVGEAADGLTAIEACRRLQPDLVLMDVQMPRMDGLQATTEIKRVLPGTAVIIVTISQDQDHLFKALKAGVAGYVLKEASRQELVRVVRAVLAGEAAMPPALAATLLRRMVTASHPASVVYGRLTPRENEVLQLMAEGLTNRLIADQLVVSPATVKVHVERIISKLGASDRTQAAVRAVGMGLVMPRDPAGP